MKLTKAIENRGGISYCISADGLHFRVYTSIATPLDSDVQEVVQSLHPFDQQRGFPHAST